MDENVPNSLKTIIKDIGFDAITLKDENQLGIKNGEVAKLALTKNAILITLDSDFLSLKKELQKKSRIIYFKIHPRDPKKIAELIRNNLKDALEKLKKPGKVVISDDNLEFMAP